MATVAAVTPKPDQAAVVTSAPVVTHALLQTVPAVPPVSNASGVGLTTGKPVIG